MALYCHMIITMAYHIVGSVLLFCVTISLVFASGDTSCNVTCEYTAWALDANCRNRGLTEVPLECSQSEMVDLRNNDLTYLGPGSFAGYRSLRYVDLEFNQISNIANGAFEECISLQNIYLQFNSLYEVAGRAFEGASDLKRLFLNQNSITYMHPDAFVGLDKLSGLYIGHNDITNLHALVFRNTPLLKYLHMGDNGLTAFPSGIFRGLTKLKYMNAENNNLRSIDGSLFESLENLEELNLSGNLIVSVTNFPILPQFKIFDLFDNDLNDIDDLAAKINRLDQLYLAKNDNLNCTCSVDPIRVWVTNHLNDEGVDILRANVTCGWPQHLKGYPLCNLTKSSLCPAPEKFSLAGVQPFNQITTVKSFKGKSNDISADEPRMSRNSGLNLVILSMVVAVITAVFVILALVILITYLKCRTHKHQQAHKVPQGPRQQQQQEGHAHASQVHKVPNRQIQDDDGAYEPVCFRPSSPPDSAFGSQDDVFAMEEEEAQSWLEPTYRVPPYGSENSNEFGNPSPPYMTFEECKVKYASPSQDSLTVDEEPPPLGKDWLITDPFIKHMRENQAVCNSEAHTPLPLKQMATPYISHHVFVRFFHSPRHDQYPIPQEVHVLKPLCNQHDQDETPGQTKEHAQTLSTSPFQNSSSKIPFINCA